jgi:hypothetical protein
MRDCKEALKLAVAERQKYISRVKVGNMEQYRHSPVIKKK